MMLIGFLGSAPDVDPLLDHLSDAAAASAIRDCGRTRPTRSERRSRRARGRTRRPNSRRAHIRARALGQIGGRRAVDALVPIARDDEFEPARAAAEALSESIRVGASDRKRDERRPASARGRRPGGDVSNLEKVLVGFSNLSFVYFVVLNTLYLVLTAVAWREMTKELSRRAFLGLDEIFRSPLTPGISVLVPAFDERAVIVESVRSLMALRYPVTRSSSSTTVRRTTHCSS
jgi:hypothetical protein